MTALMRAQAAYDELVRRAREESLLESCAALLGWDEETYMPRAGAAHRAAQLGLLAGLVHERAVDPRVGELLAEVEGSELMRDPLAPAAVNVREWRRLYGRAVRLPRPLVEEIARTTTLAQQEWAAARRAADFAAFRPWLERVFLLKRREAEALGGPSLYDALLEEYEPGITAAEISTLLEGLRRELVPFVEAIGAAPGRPDVALLHRAYPVERQKSFGSAAAAALGFDFQRGRLDVATHPFCTRLGPEDCRLTARYDENDFSEGFFTILHEAGHGLYEQGLDAAHHGTPLGEAASLGLHESQSRLYENLVGRSRGFWRHFFPLARRAFPEALAGVTPDAFHFAVNAVRPSLIRVQADEVTYNLHILIRFELERALLSGDLPAADLPAAWAEAYRRHLGITPADDAEGCLQDGHWASGLVGYFPTYTLGNAFAAQLFARADADLGGLEENFAKGDFAGLLGWLRARVHCQGQRYPAARLVEVATGSPPDPFPLVKSLHTRYGEEYGL
jgi:carboxypeptidase Taq